MGKRLLKAGGVLVTCGAVFLMVLKAPVDYSNSDPAGCLLTSQSLLTKGTTRLDDYYPEIKTRYQWQAPNWRGHYYYMYPIGTSLFALPAVRAANAMGLDMFRPDDDRSLQRLLAACTVSLSFFLAFAVLRHFATWGESFWLSMAFILGSPIASTMGAALWSSNLTIVFLLLSVLLLVRNARGERPFNPWLMGFLVFSAYLCKPTVILFIVLLVVHLMLNRRSALVGLSVMLLLLGTLFVLYSFWCYGQAVPPYYHPGQNTSGVTRGPYHLWIALYGNLLSPSRGLLVGSPYLLLMFLGLLMLWKDALRSSLLWLSMLWFGLHWGMVSWWPCWWGGSCFGSRLMTEAFPALLLATGIVWAFAKTRLSALQRTVVVGTFSVLTMFALFVHTYAGLYNKRTLVWNQYGVLRHAFSWRRAQFLVSDRMLQEMRDEADARKAISAAGRTRPERSRSTVDQDSTDSQVGKTLVCSLGDGVTMEFVWIPPGEFKMGSLKTERGRFGDEGRCLVCVSNGYWMARHEVTQRQWQRVMEENPSHFRGEDNPVERVNWDACRQFVRKMNLKFAFLDDGGRFALPTETQWEYACRAGTTTRFHSGDSEQDLQQVAWYACKGNSTHPVGQKTPNAWGLYDMHGNVWEWCRDTAVVGNQWPAVDKVWVRVLRGGSWDDYDVNCRAANKIWMSPDYARNDMGFRLVRERYGDQPSKSATTIRLDRLHLREVRE